MNVKKVIDANQWYALRVEIQGNHVKGYVDEEPIIDYSGERDMEGYLGLWTKADSVTRFRELRYESGAVRKEVRF